MDMCMYVMSVCELSHLCLTEPNSNSSVWAPQPTSHVRGFFWALPYNACICYILPTSLERVGAKQVSRSVCWESSSERFDLHSSALCLRRCAQVGNCNSENCHSANRNSEEHRPASHNRGTGGVNVPNWPANPVAQHFCESPTSDEGADVIRHRPSKWGHRHLFVYNSRPFEADAS